MTDLRELTEGDKFHAKNTLAGLHFTVIDVVSDKFGYYCLKCVDHQRRPWDFYDGEQILAEPCNGMLTEEVNEVVKYDE